MFHMMIVLSVEPLASLFFPNAVNVLILLLCPVSVLSNTPVSVFQILIVPIDKKFKS